MKNDLISQLAADHRPFRSIDTLRSLSLRYVFVTGLILFLSVAILPLRSDISFMKAQWYFYVENILWLALLISGFRASYKSSLPEERKESYAQFYFLTSALIFLSSFHHSSPGLQTELELIRGGCGLIISLLSVMAGTYFFIWARHAAPARPWRTGVLAALTSSALGCLIMQFVCAWDTSLHLILWHFIPVFILILAGQFLARKLLHW